MRKLILSLIGSSLLYGCAPTPYIATPTQPPVMAATCTNPQGIVVADQYCDANWLAQQQMIAQQSNNQALLTALILYHSYHVWYSSSPYEVGMFMRPGSYYVTRPAGYIVQPRNTYVTNVHNHTVVINNGRATSAPSPVRSSVSNGNKQPFGGPSTRPIQAYKPSSSPFGVSSSPSRTTSSSFGGSSSRSSFGGSSSRRR